jgi:hypothetical protein
MAGETPKYQYKVLHRSPTGTVLFPWAKQWMKDRFGRGALEKQINGLQKYGWQVVSMAGGSAGFLWVFPMVTVLFRRPSDYQWDDESLEEVRRLLTAGQEIPASFLYADITGVGSAEARKAVEAMKTEF